MFQRNVLASGVVPQISLVMGPCAGGAVYSPAMTDFIFMVKDSAYMFVTGPDVVKTVTHETVTQEELGGAVTHTHALGRRRPRLRERRRGAAADCGGSSISCRRRTAPTPPVRPSWDPPDRDDASLDTLVPANPNKPYDMRELIREGRRRGRILRAAADLRARTSSSASARMEGAPVGIVANQPMVLAGCLDIDSSRKAARFVRFCDASTSRSSPSSTCRASCPARRRNIGGIIKHGAKLLYAYAEATVPKVTVITRKAYGGAYDVMSSKHLRGDVNYAWPTAEIAVMGPKGAVEIIFRGDLGDQAKIEARTEEYREKFANPFIAGEPRLHRRRDHAARHPPPHLPLPRHAARQG